MIITNKLLFTAIIGLIIGFGGIVWWTSSILVPTNTEPSNASALVQSQPIVTNNPYVSGKISDLNKASDNQSYCNGASDSNCAMVKQVNPDLITSEKKQCERLQSTHDYIVKWGGDNFISTLPSLEWTSGINTCLQYSK